MKRLEPALRGIAPNTTLPILNQSDLGTIKIACPPLAEQRETPTTSTARPRGSTGWPRASRTASHGCASTARRSSRRR